MCLAAVTSTDRSPSMQRSPTPVRFSKLSGLDKDTRAFCPASSTSSLARECSLEISAEPRAHHSALSASVRSCSRAFAASLPGSVSRSLLSESLVDSEGLGLESSQLAVGQRIASWLSQSVGRSEAKATLRATLEAARWSLKACSSSPQLSSIAHGHTNAAATAEGLPVVRVPVLSSTTFCTWEPSSSGFAPLRTRMPQEAAAPVAAITAVGVARPRAQGQATSSTFSPCSNTKKALSSSGQLLVRPLRIDASGTTCHV
mmetsp:Transcript_113907/g.271204  ORF Transcript_113907/g.271204 Transcript_113907/m.271204 type:complete len:259 (+) Transcript_113907:1405-2181(+)